eukprot:TRINITY_DN2966_c1_g1_i1.p1 TRINITY_DN2966_c1_g1~~TRINITY_DN2966_c1_g1_i1.p1  ORF type:complete len:661 (+),score=89.07 TRINITY_DN2966_c1_g1_i1:82-2064(+)
MSLPRPLDVANPRRASFRSHCGAGHAVFVQRSPQGALERSPQHAQGRSPLAQSQKPPVLPFRRRSCTDAGLSTSPRRHAPPPLPETEVGELAADLLRRVERDQSAAQRRLDALSPVPQAEPGEEGRSQTPPPLPPPPPPPPSLPLAVAPGGVLPSPAARCSASAAATKSLGCRHGSAGGVSLITAQSSGSASPTAREAQRAAAAAGASSVAQDTGAAAAATGEGAGEIASLRRRIAELSRLQQRAEARARAAEDQVAEVRRGVAVYGDKVKARKQELRGRIAELEAEAEHLRRRCAAAEAEAANLRAAAPPPAPLTAEAEAQTAACPAAAAGSQTECVPVLDAGCQTGSGPLQPLVPVVSPASPQCPASSRQAERAPPRKGLLSLRYSLPAADGSWGEGAVEARTVLSVSEADHVADLLRRCCEAVTARSGVVVDAGRMCLRADGEDLAVTPPLGLVRSTYHPEGRQRVREFSIGSDRELRSYAFFQAWVRRQPDPFHIALSLAPLTALAWQGTPQSPLALPAAPAAAAVTSPAMTRCELPPSYSEASAYRPPPGLRRVATPPSAHPPGRRWASPLRAPGLPLQERGAGEALPPAALDASPGGRRGGGAHRARSSGPGGGGSRRRCGSAGRMPTPDGRPPRHNSLPRRAGTTPRPDSPMR